MHLLVTGGNGTVGSALRAEVARRGGRFSAWDRAMSPPDEPASLPAYLDAVAPTAIIHAAVPSTGTGRANEGELVHVEWTGRLAQAAADRGLPFLYISTVMVFSDRARGPFTIDTEPDATEGYGGDKRRGERAALAAHPGARIARIGWQIGERPGGNQMLTYFAECMRREGAIRASTRFVPATSFLCDTAAALLDRLAGPPGLYLVDANRGWNFYEIASALNTLHGHPWRVEPIEAFAQDQRMLDARVELPSLRTRLPALSPRG